MSVPSRLVLVAIASLLSACSLAPKNVRPAGVVPPTLPQGGIYPVVQPAAVAASDIAWRDFFIDPRLQQVIAKGLENNRDLRIAAANVLQARAQYRVQRADRLPTIAASSSASYGDTSNDSNSGNNDNSSVATDLYSINVGLSAFEIDLFGRVRNLSRASLEQYLATEEGQKATRISLIAEIASAWLTLAADRDQLTVARNTLASAEQSLTLTQARFRVGVVSQLEVTQAETLYQGALNDIAALSTRIAQDQNALDLLVGVTVNPEYLPEGLGDGDQLLSALPVDLSADILLQRPDVRQAEHRLRAENANIGAARAALFPRISLTSSIGTISGALSGLFTKGTEAWTVQGNASLPIFDFGRRQAGLRFAEASQQAAVAQYEKTLQTAFREVADALAMRGTINEQVAARAARAEAAATAARLSDARYRAGVDSFLVSLDAQRTAYSARQELVNGRLTRATNLINLYRSLGGGLQ